MCGLAGVIWKSGDGPRRATSEMLAVFEPLIAHRGPDERGVHVDDGFGVVHRRLSIIDIATGQQPMLAAGGSVGIAYNGEVYNHATLRLELEARGCKFTTHSDTEVVLQMYLQYGADAFDRLDGMFAIFIWDTRGSAPVYYLVRDHLGTKPLYVYEDARCIAFASELRPLLSMPGADLALNGEGLQSYLTYRYTQAPDTFYKNIRRVEAGAYYRISGRSVFRTRFWDMPNVVAPRRLNEREAQEQLASLLRASVAAQQMSEVPVGLLLSGGLDSSVIASLCGELNVRLKSFNIGFPALNEFPYSSEMARTFGLEHLTVETTVPEIVGRFDRVVDAMDEPIADPACFPLHILCDHIKRDVTVVLSGEGSDEMLAGYPQYALLLNGPPTRPAHQFAEFQRASWYFSEETASLMPGTGLDRTRRHAGYFMERPLLEGMLAYDLKTWLPENLMMKADKILMSHSLEGRFPFLSKDIVEFACSLPEHMKIADGGKCILRRAFADRLPKNILSRKKMGFSVPVDQLVIALRERLEDLFPAASQSALAEHVNFQEVRRRLDAHYAGHTRNALWVWTMLVLLHWMESRGEPTGAPASARVRTFV